MRKLNLVFLTVALLMFSQVINAQHIAGSKHDFSGQSWAQSQICLPCHTPHNALVYSEAPLWNHALTSTTFTLYNTSTFNGASTISQPDGNSKLCLSCHDGTVALQNFGGVTSGNTYVTGAYNLGNNLSNDHPVSFTYNTALATADPGLYNPAVALSGITPSGTIQADMLFADKMQCASCHDVHNGYGLPNLLVKTNTGSALCLTCHNK